MLMVSSCGTNESKENIDSIVEKMLSEKHSPIVFNPEPTPAFIVVKEPKDLKLAQKVNISIKKPINIIAAIDFADSTLSISPDSGVDLNKKFNIKFNNQTLGVYFDFLENITGYHIELLDGVVYIKSIQTQTWHLQSLSSDNVEISSAKSDIGASIQKQTNVDGWNEIIEQVEVIMNLDDSPKFLFAIKKDAEEEAKMRIKAFSVVHNKQLGTVTVTGVPKKLEQVDIWLSGLIKSSNRQVHLQVQVLDVTIDESVGQGINWNLISKQSSGQFQISNNSKQVIDGAGLVSIGSPLGTALNLGNKISLSVMLNFLRKQGNVRVDNQPNITVTNGREAYITTGDEFSYIASIKSATDAQGQITTTSDIQRMSVGIDMRVTPKILPNNRIVVNIVPIISSIKSFTTLTSGSNNSMQEFKTPNIALQKLRTQVIVESGKTIHLGGLIASKVANAAKGLPGGGIMDMFFRGVQKSLERREIVILITPTIVGG
jgi:type II secretory pathway component GspD/PulD (secretin)